MITEVFSTGWMINIDVFIRPDCKKYDDVYGSLITLRLSSE
jgi:hypothetical protein